MENKYPNRYLLETGIGLQDVDHLKNSSFFLQESQRYLKGEISLDELEDLVNSYYKSKHAVEDRKEVRLLHLLKDNPTLRTDELASELGVSLRTIKNIIAALRKDGKLERLGGKKYGRWEVKQ